MIGKLQKTKHNFWERNICGGISLECIDALIGNYDRHNGNWGILVNDSEQKVKMAPVYDCGSCLCSQLTDEQMKQMLDNQTEINNRIYNKPTSTITENGRRINYYDFIYSLKNKDCNNALEKIVNEIDMSKIDFEIDNMPIISEIRKKFYKVLLNGRYNVILRKSYNKLKNIYK